MIDSMLYFIVIEEYGIILICVGSYTRKGNVPPLTVMHFGAFSAGMESSDLFTISSPKQEATMNDKEQEQEQQQSTTISNNKQQQQQQQQQQEKQKDNDPVNSSWFFSFEDPITKHPLLVKDPPPRIIGSIRHGPPCKATNDFGGFGGSGQSK